MTRWLLRAAVSAAVAWILFRIVPPRAVMDAVVRTSPGVFFASLAVFLAGHYLNAQKLRILIGAEHVTSGVCVRAHYAGLVANLGLPGLASGDLVRAAYLTPSVGTRRVVIASVVDRVLDTLTLLVLVAIALPVAGIPPAIAAVVQTGAWWFLGGAAAGLVAVVMLRLRAGENSSSRVGQAWSEVKTRRPALAGAAAISLLVQSAFVLTNVWLARYAGVEVGVAAWFVAWPISKLVAVLPISLGGLGVREAALVSLLAPYGAPRESVLASGLLWQGVLALSGLGGLLFTTVRRRATRRTSRPTPSPASAARS